jgi:hypothetical protein
MSETTQVKPAIIGNPNAVPEDMSIAQDTTTVMPGGPSGGQGAVTNGNTGTEANTPAGNFAVNNSSVASNSDYVGNTNVTDMTTSIANDTSAFIDGQGANLSDQVPDIDPNEEGTNLDGSDYNMDADGLNQAVATGAVDTASRVVPPSSASTYDAATTSDQVANNLADAATMETNEDAIVDPEGIVLDQQGLATGVNEDGSVNETGLALNSFAHQNISNVIDTSTVAGKLLAQSLGEGNYLDSKATVKGQLEILTGEFVDPVTGEPKIPTWAAGIARNVSRSIAFKGITGTAATGALAQAMIEATLPIAQADSQFYQTLTVKNLDNKQQMIINKANVLSKMELANLDVRTSLAVNNAKTFMQYDMANLANEQQTAIINSQSMVQSILEDANQTNVARRFNSEQQNEMDKFYDNLGAQIDMYNTGQVNQMSMFNAGERNDMSQFNAQLENSREQFYLDMQYQVDAANAQWRQTVTLTETEMAFNAAATDVKNILNLSSEVMNQLWDRTDSLLDYAWREGENALDREANIEMAKMQLEAAKAQAKAQKKSGLFGGLGSAIGSIAGAMIMTSDSRMKKNVVEKAELANGVKLYSWEWADAAKARGWDKGPTTGVIAQQVMQVKPESVYADKEGYLKVDYRGIEQ